MCIADGNAAIKAFCYRIVAAGIANRILYVCCFNNSTLHALAFYFDMQGNGKGRNKSAYLLNRWLRQLPIRMPRDVRVLAEA